MKNHLLLFAALLIVASSSCKKNDAAKAGDKLWLVKKSTGADANAGSLITYTYDTQNRIVKEAGNGSVVEYKYEGNKFTRTITQGVQTSVFQYELNAQGYIAKLKIPDGTISSYEYNAGGLLTRSYDNRMPQYDARYYYNNATGLLDSIRSTVGGAWNSTATFAYDKDRKNSLQNKNFGMSYAGNLYPRPFTHYEYKYIDGGVVKTQTTDYTFTYDIQGRIASRSFISAGQRYTAHYTYY